MRFMIYTENHHENRHAEIPFSTGLLTMRLAPNVDRQEARGAARKELAKGTGVLKTAKLLELGTGTVQRLKHAMALKAAIAAAPVIAS